MIKKKRHHYIPRFYLKRFSINNEGKFLSLYNLKNKKFIESAPLKSQAYTNFLYGEDDEVENALAKMEDDVARMFYYWTEERILVPPPKNSNGFKLLKRFILYQAYRTPKSGKNAIEVLNQSLNVFLKEFKPDIWESMKGHTLSHENPVLLSLINSIKHEKLLDFLDCKFLVNLSLLPFITSDSPVIKYNQLMEKADNYIGATGLVAKGLQIFYPIHPRLMICLYDPNVYEFGDGCKECYSTESIEDIHQLNGLQLVNCESQLFFYNLISKEYISGLCKDYEKYRGTSKKINEVVKKQNRKFLFISSEDIQINLNLNFFKLKIEACNFKEGLVPLRHISLDAPPSKGIVLDD